MQIFSISTFRKEKAPTKIAASLFFSCLMQIFSIFTLNRKEKCAGPLIICFQNLPFKIMSGFKKQSRKFYFPPSLNPPAEYHDAAGGFREGGGGGGIRWLHPRPRAFLIPPTDPFRGLQGVLGIEDTGGRLNYSQIDQYFFLIFSYNIGNLQQNNIF